VVKSSTTFRHTWNISLTVALFNWGREDSLAERGSSFHPQTFGMMTKKETDRAAEHDTISNKNCWPAANIFIRIGGGGISELFRALLYQ
jgi:hypothetical protein